MSSTRRADIQFGNEDLLCEDEFDPQFGKQRISLMIDLQVIEAFKAKAQKEGKKYQVLMRETLRDAVFGKSEIDEIMKRLETLEQKVG